MRPFVTGMGAVSALGLDVASMARAIDAGRDGIAPIERFSTEGMSAKLAGMVPWPRLDPPPSLRELCVAFSVRAAVEALADAGARPLPCAPDRAAIVVGTSLADDGVDPHRIAEDTARALGIAGPRVTISTACASSTNAIGLGADLLAAGEADLVVAGGADVLTPEIFAGFHALGLLAAGKCAPFGEPAGATLGEGAGFVILEPPGAAEARGRKPLATLISYGLSADAHHATSPDPSGAGMARAIRGALDDAGVDPSVVDYVNAHGTGTAANDPSEWRAIRAALGDRAAAIPVSATKGFLGHAQGAAGILELVATLVCLRRGLVPPSLRVTRPRPHAPADPVASDRPRVHAVRVALSNSAAFGGANAVVAIASNEPAIALRAPHPPRRVWILGAGAVGPFGLGVDRLVAALGEAAPIEGRARPFDLQDLIPTADPRGLDPSSRLLAAAAAGAIASSGVAIRGATRDVAGLFVGITRASPESTKELQRSIRERGLPRLSAAAFTRLVLNAPAGACTRLLALRGPTTTLSTGAGSGAAAIAYAARWLERRRDAEILLAAGVDELADDAAEGALEAAACLVLSTSPPARGPRVLVAGHALAGPGRIDDAIARARAQAGRAGETASPLDGEHRASLGRADAAGGVLACVAAFAAVVSGARRSVLVAEPGEGAACALILTSEEMDGR